MSNGASFWQAINPQLTIGAPIRPDPLRLDGASLDGISQKLTEDGWLQTPPLFSEDVIGPLRQGVLNLGDRGLPPVYIYVYDEAWRLFAALRPLISHFLGEDFRLLPNFWAWHVPTTKGASGWPPHRDCQAKTRFADGLGGELLMSLSLWVPLTDASTDNGCMHVLPRDREAGYNPPLDDPDRIDLAQGVALPAQAGSVLGWPQDLYHWSGQATGRSQTPRISLSLEFQNPAFAPLRDPLLDIANPPGLDERLALIAEQIPRYRHMEQLEFDPATLPS